MDRFAAKLTVGLDVRKYIPIVIGALFFAFSMFVYPYYIYGDQTYYREFYEIAPSWNWVQAYSYYQRILGTVEPGYFLIVKVFSPMVGKDFLMSSVNGALVYSLIYWAQKRGVSWLAIVLLAPNFYLMVIFFSAERLKVGMLFLMLAVNTSGAFLRIWASLAFVTQAQTIFLGINWLMIRILPPIRAILGGRFKKSSWKILVLLVGSALLLNPMMGYLLAKYDAYSSRSGGIFEILKPLAFLLLTLWYARSEKMNAFLMHLPIIIGAFAVGGERLVIFSYFVFLSFALRRKRGMNVAVVFTSLYFGYKGFDFLDNILEFGDGFQGLKISG
jgi:hypothetical protein